MSEITNLRSSFQGFYGFDFDDKVVDSCLLKVFEKYKDKQKYFLFNKLTEKIIKKAIYPIEDERIKLRTSKCIIDLILMNRCFVDKSFFANFLMIQI